MNQTPKTRHYDLDWLRVAAIIILLFYHTGMFFNTWGWHIKSEEQSKIFNYIMIWFHFWRMPLLLFISGAGTYFALGFRSSGKFLKERSKRLFIPLLFGMFVIVPPQIYFEFIEKFSSYISFYPTVFEFQPYPGGSLSWHHLWFILYLFLYSVVCLPIFLYFRKEKSSDLRDKIHSLFSKKFGPAIFLVPMILSQFMLRPFFPKETHDLTDLAYFVHYLLYFISGYIIYSDKRNWQILKTHRKINLITAVVFAVIFYAVWIIQYNINFFGYDFIFHIPTTIMSWFTILAIIGYGQKYLNKKSELLAEMNAGIYPFYILHQSVMIIFGFYIIQWEISIFSKFIIINFLTAIFCVGFYYLFIKPFNLMRLLFGMKPKKKISKKSENIFPAVQEH